MLRDQASTSTMRTPARGFRMRPIPYRRNIYSSDSDSDDGGSMTNGNRTPRAHVRDFSHHPNTSYSTQSAPSPGISTTRSTPTLSPSVLTMTPQLRYQQSLERGRGQQTPLNGTMDAMESDGSDTVDFNMEEHQRNLARRGMEELEEIERMIEYARMEAFENDMEGRGGPVEDNSVTVNATVHAEQQQLDDEEVMIDVETVQVVPQAADDVIAADDEMQHIDEQQQPDAENVLIRVNTIHVVPQAADGAIGAEVEVIVQQGEQQQQQQVQEEPLDLSRPKCSVCWDDLLSKDPRYAPCKHVICFTCLEKTKAEAGSIFFPCPICRGSIQLNRCKKMIFP